MQVVHVDQQEKLRVFTVSGGSAPVADAIKRYFEGEKYRLEKGTPEDAVYGIGNAFMRFMFGAFVKRYKFSIKLEQAGGDTKVRLAPAMSGASGGVIGWNKMKKEFERQAQNVHNALANA